MTRKTVRPPDVEPVHFHGMITVSDKMTRLFEMIQKVARSEASVLVRGESGTGKELVARAVHALSPRFKGPFQAVNCATLTREMMISELFGHVKGAFTGAVAARKGLFELSHKGSIFLDEIAEIPFDIQARLLRIVQEKVFAPLGSSETRDVNVRLISATHRALRHEVERGRFREDLMYRIRVIPVFLPRLAERERDVEVLAWRFIEEFNQSGFRRISAMEKKALDALLDYPWPGNIRELRNNIEYAFVIGEGEVLKYEDLTPELQGKPPPEVVAFERDLKEKQKLRILDALKEAEGKKEIAAQQLGISRSTLWRKMRELQIG